MRRELARDSEGRGKRGDIAVAVGQRYENSADHLPGSNDAIASRLPTNKPNPFILPRRGDQA